MGTFESRKDKAAKKSMGIATAGLPESVYSKQKFKGGCYLCVVPKSQLAPNLYCGWSGGAMALGKLPRKLPGRPTIWMIVGQGPTALVVGVEGGCLDFFTLIYPFSPLSPSLWETAQYRLKYGFTRAVKPNLLTNLSRTVLTSI